ncbi:MAG TPA: universal stress protein [Stellaceae bacterium]|jgi:nucleotide-binding universal stress UspA family protein|nr:universal stress protein [Stellaceae bacterium]
MIRADDAGKLVNSPAAAIAPERRLIHVNGIEAALLTIDETPKGVRQMTFKDLIVHLDSRHRCAQRLDYAARLAARSGAHLTGLYTLDFVPALTELVHAYPARTEQLEIYNRLRATELDRAKEAQQSFEEALRREGLEGEWRLIEGPHAETAAVHAHYADLAIVGQIDPQDPPAINAERIPEAVLLGSGRPVLVVPYAGSFATVGQRVLVAWTATAEAARSLADAMPLLQNAEKVTVLTVNPSRVVDAETGIPGADIAIHLARHGVTVEVKTMIVDEITVGDTILNAAFDYGADLLVMGGYGPIRARVN